MKKIETGNSDALEHVDPRRRGFLAKLIAGGVALPAMTTVALGQGKGGAGRAKGGAKGKGGKGRSSNSGRGGQNPAARDPAAFAARLIEEFDKDGDNALNARELAAAIQSMNERRGMRGESGGGQGRGKGGAAGKGKGDAAGKGKGDGAGKGKGKGKGNGAGKGKGGEQSIGGAGVKPKKPGE